MNARLRQIFDRLSGSLWFVPGVMTVAATVLALIMVRIDQELAARGHTSSTWLFGGGAEGARGVLSAIAGTMVTVAATVFSIMVVALQLASSQFTPRLLRSLMRDRGNQVTLGAFIGTFTFSLLVLRAVRSGQENGSAFVPSASVSLAIGFALISIGLLIFFIHHAASSMQASTVIDRVARDALRLIGDVETTDDSSDMESSRMPTIAMPGEPISASRSGYLVHVDLGHLKGIAKEHGLILLVERSIGDHVLPGTVLMRSVRPETDAGLFDNDTGKGRDLQQELRGAFQFASERYEQYDLEYCVQRLADIAIRALSPGINDPTTAILCIDRLAEILLRAAGASRTPSLEMQEDGESGIIWDRDRFERIAAISFDDITHFAADTPRVMFYLAETVAMLIDLVPPSRTEALTRSARDVLERGNARLVLKRDQFRLEQILRSVLPA